MKSVLTIRPSMAVKETRRIQELFKGWLFIGVRRLRFSPANGAPLAFMLGFYMRD